MRLGNLLILSSILLSVYLLTIVNSNYYNRFLELQPWIYRECSHFEFKKHRALFVS